MGIDEIVLVIGFSLILLVCIIGGITDHRLLKKCQKSRYYPFPHGEKTDEEWENYLKSKKEGK